MTFQAERRVSILASPAAGQSALRTAGRLSCDSCLTRAERDWDRRAPDRALGVRRNWRHRPIVREHGHVEPHGRHPFGANDQTSPSNAPPLPQPDSREAGSGLVSGAHPSMPQAGFLWLAQYGTASYSPGLNKPIHTMSHTCSIDLAIVIGCLGPGNSGRSDSGNHCQSVQRFQLLVQGLPLGLLRDG